MKQKLPKLFKNILYSYKFSSIDPQKHKKEIIVSTINYGGWEHWRQLFRIYSKKEIKKIIKETPKSEFRPQALKLISLLLNLPKQNYASRSTKIRAEKNF
ncbi:MAG: hypothetical protein LR000_00990 [Candidatus Pacebacteria bacterium]|nr:hypothetical protein [Candidatus Paceibacterota bacterium]